MSKNIRVLIVDDNRDFTCILQDCLNACQDIEIVGVAENGSQAYRMIKDSQPDVLLLDIVMPAVDGLEVLKQLSNTANKMAIFVMSALGNDSIVRNALSLGAHAYFQKPLDINAIISRIYSFAL
jgi:two-component system response regulator (stage 0 sporulation protein A)